LNKKRQWSSIFSANILNNRTVDPQVVEIDGRPKIEVEYKNETKTFFAEEVSSMVLTKMKETAEAYLGHDVKDAVVTVPAVS
jgi:molecular chaperone DnaK (HSP70)